MTDATVPTRAHIQLRDGTRDAHEAAEATDGMRLLMAGGLDEAGYEGLLRAQLGLFEAWETERAGWLAGGVGGAGWSYVSRASLLRSDLAIANRVGSHQGISSADGVGSHQGISSADGVGSHQGISSANRVGSHQGPGSAGDVPCPVGANPVGDSSRVNATCWGELYVIEGSALGGRLIVRRLRELYPHRAHRFYAIGEDAPSAWRRFQQILDTHLPDDASRRAAVDGALHMFSRFRQVLKDPLAHV